MYETLLTMDLEKTEIQIVWVKSISLTFRSAVVSENLSTVDLQKTNSVEDERSLFQLLSIDSIVEIIVDAWIWKRQIFSQGREKWSPLTFHRRDFANHLDDWSWKDRVSRGERREHASLRWTSVCRSLTTMDPKKTHSFEERQIDFSPFDGWVCLDHCRRLI